LETKNGFIPQESSPASHHDSVTLKGLISLHTICTSNAYTCLKLLNIKAAVHFKSLDAQGASFALTIMLKISQLTSKIF